MHFTTDEEKYASLLNHQKLPPEWEPPELLVSLVLRHYSGVNRPSEDELRSPSTEEWESAIGWCALRGWLALPNWTAKGDHGTVYIQHVTGTGLSAAGREELKKFGPFVRG